MWVPISNGPCLIHIHRVGGSLLSQDECARETNSGSADAQMSAKAEASTKPFCFASRDETQVYIC